MKMPVNSIRRRGLLNESAVMIEDLVKSKIFAAGIARVTDMIDAMPIVNPAASLAVGKFFAEFFAADALEHPVDLVPAIVVIEELGRNDARNFGFNSAQLDLA